jgi:hypothetical protein
MSLTSGGRSVGMVRSRTQTMEFFLAGGFLDKNKNVRIPTYTNKLLCGLAKAQLAQSHIAYRNEVHYAGHCCKVELNFVSLICFTNYWLSFAQMNKLL